MKCIDVKENMDALLDGEAGISNEREIENHLEICADCRAEFESLNAISGVLKHNLAVSASAILDEKVFSAFDNFHAEQPKAKTTKEKISWFGIPRFAFAAALVLFALGIVSAFQIGKMSAGEISVVIPEVQESKSLANSPNTDFAENKQPNVENNETTKIIEVPVIKEKIVEVPVIKEKIVTKTVYVNKNGKPKTKLPAKEEFALKNKVEDNKYLTRSNLEGFQPVSEMNLRVSKEVNQK